MLDAATYRKCMRHRLGNSKVVALLLVCLSILSCLCESAAQGENSVKELSSVVKKDNSRKRFWKELEFQTNICEQLVAYRYSPAILLLFADGDASRHSCSVNAP